LRHACPSARRSHNARAIVDQLLLVVLAVVAKAEVRPF
jgi:hypothetical protein